MKRLIQIAYDDAKKELENDPKNNSIGFDFIIWDRARELFKERHGVEWPEPPREPGVIVN